ncbi:MAG: hypothetical protein U1E37_08770 [Sphingomonadaceae bacterium]
MYKVAILQSDREAIRAGYVEIAPTLAEQAELLDYAFRVFDTSNLSDLFGETSNDLMQFDSLIIGTNATSEQPIIQALQKERGKLAEFLSSGRGVYVGSQKKLSQRWSEQDTGLQTTGFLPDQLELCFVERPAAESDSGQGRIREAATPPSVTATSSDLILHFPRTVKASHVETICATNRFRRHFYRSMLRPAYPACYDTLLHDEKSGLRRNLLIASSGRTELARVVASTIVLDWELHTDLLVNIVRFITEGKPSFAFFHHGASAPGDYRYILDSARIAKLSHVCYNESLPDPNDAVVRHHETLIFAPGWDEADVFAFRENLINADLKIANEVVRRRFYHVLAAEDGMPPRLVQTTTISAVDRECDEGIAALKPRVKNGLWEASFWTTFDVLMLLQQRGGDASSFIDETIEAISAHLVSGSYDSVMPASCATLELRFACSVGSFGQSDKVCEFGAGWPETLTWIVRNFAKQSPYDQLTAALVIARLKRDPRFVVPAKVRGVEEIAQWRPSQTGTSELDLIRALEFAALTGPPSQQRSEMLDRLLEMQAANGAWADERRTGLVCDILARVIRGTIAVEEQRHSIDIALFKGVNFLRSLKLSGRTDAEPLASALALRALDSFNRALPISTQDFLPEIGRSADETIQSNALRASSQYIDDCLRQIADLKRRLSVKSEAAAEASQQASITNAELRAIRSARRVDLIAAHKWRLFATTSGAIAIGLIGSLAVLHQDTLKSLVTELGSALALMVSAVVGAIAGLVMQRPEASVPEEME